MAKNRSLDLAQPPDPDMCFVLFPAVHLTAASAAVSLNSLLLQLQKQPGDRKIASFHPYLERPGAWKSDSSRKLPGRLPGKVQNRSNRWCSTLEPVIKTKLDLVLKLKDIENALRERGIAVNQANIKRLVNLIKNTPISANAEFYEGVPTDRVILPMYGFTFERKEESPDG
jgi:hypothetical protein